MSTPSTGADAASVYLGLINSPATQVVESIDGLLLTSPHLRKLDGGRDIKVVVRGDWVDAASSAGSPVGEVALLSGGGDGHAPAHSGFVGRGMLTAAVSGEVFASPSVAAVLAAIRAIGRRRQQPTTTGGAGDADTGEGTFVVGGGVLLVVKCYTGDRLNFGLAMQQAQLEGLPVDMVVVGDDVALPRAKGVTGRRGLAGTILVHKVAGHAAQLGLPLAEVARRATTAGRRIVTLGVATAACSVPGAPVATHAQRLPHGWMELGMGIHNEPGMTAEPLVRASDLVERMLDRLLSREPEFDYFWRTDGEEQGQEELQQRAQDPRGEQVVLLVNSLGSATATELHIFVACCLASLARRAFRVRRLIVGPLMTALNMPGISISLMGLPSSSESESAESESASAVERDWLLAALDHPVPEARGWPGCVKDPHAPMPLPVPLPPTGHGQEAATASTSPSLSPLLSGVLRRVSAALLAARAHLNALDARSGDGDCGTTMAKGAERLDQLVREGKLPSTSLIALLRTVGQEVGESMGGSSGAIVQILIIGAAATAATAANASSSASSSASSATSGASPTSSWSLVELARALLGGCAAVTRFGGAHLGDRTMLDALLPALDALLTSSSSTSAASTSTTSTSSSSELLRVAALAARRGADGTKHMASRAGRANYVSGAALSEQDPGAEACALMWEAAAQAADEAEAAGSADK